MDKTWSNTVLVAYSLLPKILNDIDFGVKHRINSSFQSKHLRIGISTEKLIDDIMKLNESKRKIINLKFIISTTLKKLSFIDREILFLRVIKKQTFQQISTKLNISLRTTFRRFDKAQQLYKQVLADTGYTEEWFAKEYSDEVFISEIYKKIVNEKYFIAKSM